MPSKLDQLHPGTSTNTRVYPKPVPIPTPMRSQALASADSADLLSGWLGATKPGDPGRWASRASSMRWATRSGSIGSLNTFTVWAGGGLGLTTAGLDAERASQSPLSGYQLSAP